MVATATAIAGLIGAGASAGSGIMGMFANQGQQQRQAQIEQEQLDLARQNAVQQQMVQALVNQRAVSGTQDSFGTTTAYDPATNTWRTQLGPLPQAVQASAYNADVAQNTTDRARVELANEMAARRAAAAGPAADAAARDVASYRPMQGNELTGLLTDQAVTAARQAYDPLRADVLRSTARTGTAAGPVLAELGRSEAANLRQSLIDAQVQGMSGVGNINQQRLGNLTSRASTEAALANPSLSTPPVAGSSTNDLLNQLTASAAQRAGATTAAGATGPNAAFTGANTAATGAAGTVPSSNADLQKAMTGLQTLSTDLGPKGAVTTGIQNFANWWNGPNANSDPMTASQLATQQLSEQGLKQQGLF